MLDTILSADKEDAPRCSGGRCNFSFPPLTGGLTLESQIVQSCVGCSKAGTHDPAEYVYFNPGHNFPYEVIAEKHRVTVEDVLRVVNAFVLLRFLCYGIVHDILYNSGWTANNISQQQSYEIIETSRSDGSSLDDNQLIVRGRNPKCISYWESSQNDDWIGRGGDEGNRLDTDTKYCHLPVGGLAKFAWPSVLERKITPMVEKIEVLDSVLEDCRVKMTFAHDVSWAMDPVDLIYENNDEWHLTIYWYQVYSEDWPHPQPAYHMHLTFIEETIEPDDLDEDGKYIVNKRVLYPDLIDDITAFYCTARYGDSKILVEWDDLSVSTTQGDGVWSVVFDFSQIDFDTATLQYFREADPGESVVLQVRSSCTNSIKDWSESYEHDNGHYCNRRIGADGAEDSSIAPHFSNYRYECWQPDCPGFSIERIFDCSSGGWLNRLWTNADLILKQGIPGLSSHRNISIERPWGNRPSLHLMSGFYNEEVGAGIGHATHELYHGAVLGQRVEYSDGDDTKHLVRHGAFWGRGGLYTGDNEFDMADMASAPGGLYPSVVSGWKTKTAPDGESYTTTNDPSETHIRYPHRNIGNVDLYEYTNSGHGLCRTEMKRASLKSWVSGFGTADLPNDAEEAIMSTIRTELGL